MQNRLPLFFALLIAAIGCFLQPNILKAQPNTPPVTTNVTLCSVSFGVVEYDLNNAVTDAEGGPLAFTLTQAPSSGTLTLNPNGSITYVPQFTGFEEYFIYTVCDSNGACTNGTLYITLAEIETIPPIEPTISDYAAEMGAAITICDGNIGWAWQHNCIPDLYTVCVYHNDALGQITYVNDNCITYTPFGTGADTIKVIGCGDAPPPILFTCNGWEQMNTCSHNYYVVSIVPNNNAFTETYSINCDSTLLIGQLGYPTWVVPTIITPPANGSAAILTDGLWSTLQYIPNPNFNGTDTVVVECAHATQITCETGTYIINIDCTNSAGYLPLQPPAITAWYNATAASINIGYNGVQQTGNHISLYNASGALLFSSGNSSQIDAAALPAGLYLVVVKNDYQTVTAKVMVTK